jgi:hypothetical protein
MNNIISFNVREQEQNNVVNTVATTIARFVSSKAQQSVSHVTYYYSKVLEQELDNKQTLCLLNAQLAFVMTVFPTGCPWLLRIACACWLVSALLKCKEKMGRQ